MKVLNYTGLQNLWTNIRNYITAHTPTKTSDLTNDSNFVDTSNSAVASGITSAKVTSYDNHIADTDIHVTTADKTKWNNGVSQAFVFRYSSTALVASSTNNNTLLDNTDNLKVGDKVIDSSGVLFSITAIDTANSTFTIGTALVDLAQDSDVVHKSGNETVGGVKSFSNDIIRGFTTIASRTIKGNGNTPAIGSNGVGYIQNQAILTYQDSTPAKDVSVTLEVQDSNYTDGKSRAFFPKSNNVTNLGKSGKRWANVYATNYYYGGSEIEFSQKFVTTDTAQTISGSKTFSSNTLIYNSDNTATTPNLYLKSSKIETSSQGNTSGDQNLTYLDKNNTAYAYIKGAIQSNGSAVKIRAIAKDSSDNSVVNELQMLAYTNGNKAIFPTYSNEVDLGVSSYKWKSFNGVEPSSLSLPDLSNGIDISSYIDVSQVSTNHYTPPANGWISISVISSARDSIQTESSSGLSSGFYACTNPNNTSEYIASIIVPCVKNDTVTIYFRSSPNTSTIKYAKFFPCQGNV